MKLFQSLHSSKVFEDIMNHFENADLWFVGEGIVSNKINAFET